MLEVIRPVRLKEGVPFRCLATRDMEVTADIIEQILAGNKKYIDSLLYWRATPQGSTFWAKAYRGLYNQTEIEKALQELFEGIVEPEEGWE